MGMYSCLSDENLQEKILSFTEAYEKVVMGGVVTVVAGEGRRVEYTRANVEGLKSLLDMALREQDTRNGVNTSRAIPVRFGW